MLGDKIEKKINQKKIQNKTNSNKKMRFKLDTPTKYRETFQF
jgi:hypothetical protein